MAFDIFIDFDIFNFNKFDRKIIRRENMLKPNKRATTRDHERVSTSDSQIARNCVQLYGSTNGADFAACLVEAIRAINNGIYPDRIQQGSSGSYFVKNLEGETIGVFKPKNEEPYETLNPKWIKCMHRLFFPCCFGRSCLVPNQGYLSEAGAYLIDKRLGLNVVPKTAVVSFAAPTFNYNRMARTKARAKERIQKRYPGIGRHFRRIGLPPKRGSFQLFVHGYKDATYWLRQWEQQPEKAPPTETMQEFQQEFERMVILDYIIRNTDRGHDNWLIKYEQEELEKEEQKAEPSSATVLCKMEKADSQITLKVEANGNEEISEEFWESVAMPRVKIAAIDNGLAFPFKHPDKWRAYPFRWADLPFAQKPFSEEIVHQVLPLIDNTDFVRRIGNDLRKIFKTDKGFHKRTFAKQLTVIRGQMFNLREALRTRQSPAQLAQMKPQYIIEIKKKDKRKKKKRHGGRKKRRRNVAAAKKPVVTHMSSTSSATTTTLRPGLEEEPPVAAPALTNDEVNDPKSWHNTFQQKMHRRSPFFAIC